MRREIYTSFLKSKIAFRIFFLFIACTILPIAVLSYISFQTISNELNKRARKELHQMCKTRALDIYNNILILESKLSLIGSFAETEKNIFPTHVSQKYNDYFERVTLFNERKSISLTAGEVFPFSSLTGDERHHIDSEKVLIFIHDAKIFMIKKIASGMIIAEIKKDFLFMGESQFYVLDANHAFLSENSPPFNISERKNDFSNEFEYADNGETYIASCWPMFLRSRFLAPNWILVMSRSTSDILQPLQQFKRIFILFSLLTFLTVLYLSIIQIRRSLVPIETLKQGTLNIAAGDFKSHIIIKSGDEFEELGASFNKMSNELERMQAMLIQTEKMKTIGQMSAAIVHEINQPLTAIKGYIESVLNLDGVSEKAKKYLEITNKSVDRLSDIAGKFKRFSRSSAREPLSKLSLNDSLKSLYEVLEHQLVKKEIELILKLEEDLPCIMGNDNNLQQVFMNLVINALDAIEEENANKENTKKPLIKISTYSNNNHVIATVEDNGPGIPMEIRTQIFEPFYTTKREGRGTGLGLAVIQSIINNHKGKIEIKSECGMGSTFILTFPSAQ